MNIDFYKNFNIDLVNLTDNELYEHYNNFGKYENRIYNQESFIKTYPDFDINSYKNFNIDLINLTDIELYKHYNNFGKYENRVYNIETYPDFNINSYKNFNIDLVNLTDNELYEHYNNFGKYENRVYNQESFIKTYPDFDINSYKNFNIDLINFKDTELYEHYNNFGKYENRIYNKYIFLNIYPNLDISFINNYIYKNNIWSIFQLSIESSKKYFKTNKIDALKDIYLYNTDINIENIDVIIYTKEIIYNNIFKNRNNKWKFKDIIDNNFYDVFNISFNIDNGGTIIFYCRKEDPFFIIQNWLYSDFYYFGYYNTKKIIKLSNSFGGNDFTFPVIPKMLENINFNYFIENKNYIFFGFIGNVGHHLWQEITGLINFLNNINYHDKIDGIIIGDYDPFNFQKYLIENYNFKILFYKDLEIYNKEISNLNFFPLLLRSFFIDSKYILPVFNKISENPIKNIEKNILTIVLDIRTVSRILINITKFYIFIINKIYENYSNNYQIKIIFTGRFIVKNFIIDKLNDIEYISQINIVNNIINNVNSKNIIFDNLIGENFFIIKNNILYANIMIATTGTSIPNLLTWIYNMKGIFLANTSTFKTFSEIQFTVLKNYNALFCPKEYIIDKDNCTFDVIYEDFYNYFQEKLNEIIL